jgi:hypothetical protein
LGTGLRFLVSFDESLPNIGDLTCVTGTWSCCSRPAEGEAGAGFTNTGDIYGLTFRFFDDEKLLSIRMVNNWDKIDNLDDFVFSACGKIAPPNPQ